MVCLQYNFAIFHLQARFFAVMHMALPKHTASIDELGAVSYRGRSCRKFGTLDFAPLPST